MVRFIFSNYVRSLDQRLSLEGGVDSFEIPSSIRVGIRPQKRHPVSNIIVRTFNDRDTENAHQVTVDLNDSVLDLKFLLEPLVHFTIVCLCSLSSMHLPRICVCIIVHQ